MAQSAECGGVSGGIRTVERTGGSVRFDVPASSPLLSPFPGKMVEVPTRR